MEKVNRFKPSLATLMMMVVCLVVLFTPQITAIDWSDNIISYYKLDEVAGIVIDQTDINNGTNNGATTNVVGKINTAYDFDNSSNDNISIGQLGLIDKVSFSAWVKLDKQEPESFIIIGGISQGFSLRIANNETRFGKNGIDEVSSGLFINNTNFHFVAISYDSSDGFVDFYINNLTSQVAYSTTFENVLTSLGANGYDPYTFDGIIDEVSIWNRTLTSEDVSQLYNDGNGLAFGSGTTVLTLTSPVNGSTISDIGTNFTVEGDVTSSFNATNVTYFVWNNESVLQNETNVLFAGDSNEFNSTIYIDDFVLGDYIWGAEICWQNSTIDNCSMSLTNNTFNVVPFSVLSQSYSATAIEGDTSMFTINLSIITFERLSNVFFVYNGSSSPATFTEYDTNKWFVTFDKNIPSVSSQINLPFYWSVLLESGFVQNTTTINQTVVKIGIDDCSTFTNLLFNLSSVDEKTQTLIDGSGKNTSIKVDIRLSYLDNSQELANFSTNYSKINPASICLNNSIGNSSLRMDAIIEYTADDKFTEFYNIQNYILNNATDNINLTLYNLEESEGQEFKVTYKGQDFIPVNNLVIQVQRKYIEEGVFKTVEIPMSGSNGYTIAHLVPNDVVYNLIFIKDGVILDSFIEVIADCQNPTITECEINLNALITGTDLLGLLVDDEFFSSLSYDKDTKVVSATFGIISGVSGKVDLNVSLIDNFGNNTVCSDSLTAAGGTLTCTVPEAFGNSTIYASVIYNDEIKSEGYINQNPSPKEQYEGVIILCSIILLMFMIGMGISDIPAITGIFLILGAVMLIALNLAYSTSWIGAGATILWFILAVVIVIIKGGGKR